ncbi:MAG: 3-deoxy-manno-octulosonate cytidylyltransferase [Geminicoccaceae bacterium]|nr:3-deoxy-manno-octulosonate cytidylyltransferase [Geminicoccaceae bacterium]
MPVNPASPGSTVVMIPARLGSTRLPDKPLAEIGGVPMIVQVWRRAREADVGPVVVACAEEAIAEAVRRHGGEAVLTDPALPSGSDRISAALSVVDPARRFTRVVNLQGDLPTLSADAVRASLRPLDELEADIGTLVCPTEEQSEKDDPNVVKAIVAFDRRRPDLGRALYFTRACAPTGDGPVWHHIGIYAYRRRTLEQLAAMPPSPLERRERLEQLRALEAGIKIGVAVVETVPLGVDTPHDLARARALLANRPA